MTNFYPAFIITAGFCKTAFLMYNRIKRNAKNWAVLCFLFNIWGIIFLSFLPRIDHEEDYLVNKIKDQNPVSHPEM